MVSHAEENQGVVIPTANKPLHSDSCYPAAGEIERYYLLDHENSNPSSLAILLVLEGV